MKLNVKKYSMFIHLETGINISPLQETGNKETIPPKFNLMKQSVYWGYLQKRTTEEPSRCVLKRQQYHSSAAPLESLSTFYFPPFKTTWTYLGGFYGLPRSREPPFSLPLGRTRGSSYTTLSTTVCHTSLLFALHFPDVPFCCCLCCVEIRRPH